MTQKTIEIDVRTLYEFANQPVPSAPPSAIDVERMVKHQFAFLSKTLDVRVDGWNAFVSCPEEVPTSKAESARLAAKAGKKAGEGDYNKAVSLWKRSLELDPSNNGTRRDLAMAFSEHGNKEEAKNHLIDVLRVDPNDAWAWVVLANLYKRHENDIATAERFLARALTIAPTDPWALNSLGALRLEQSRVNDAVPLFEQALASNPKFANAYIGLAIVRQTQGKLDQTLSTIESMFSNAVMQDIRSVPVFNEARSLYAATMAELARKNHDDVFKLLENQKRELASESGYPIRVITGAVPEKTAATIQMAWKHGRDHHEVHCREGYPDELMAHLVAHELGHLRLECAARKEQRNRFPVSTAAAREKAIRIVGDDILRLQRRGYPECDISSMVIDLVHGMVRQITNMPIDMIIEAAMYRNHPVMRPCQFVSLAILAKEGEAATIDDKIKDLTPRKIYRAVAALNGMNALFLDNLWHGITNYAAPYQKLESFPMSQRLYDLFQTRVPQLRAGEEYDLTDTIAEMLGIQGWYEWRQDVGAHQVRTDAPPEGTTNPDLLKEKHPAAVWHLLAALERFERMDVGEIRALVSEISMVGQSGLDYASPEKKYTLAACPNEVFSGLQLMCLMYAGFKRIAPEIDPGMDLQEPFLTALELHDTKRGGKA